MPKKKPVSKKTLQIQTSPKSGFGKLKKLARNHRIISIIVVIVLLGGLIWLSQVAIERYQLSQAEKNLDQLAQTISQTHQANKLSKDRFCNYSSAKFSKGTLRCSINITLSYPVSDLEHANQIVDSTDRQFENVGKIDKSSISHNNNVKFKKVDLKESNSLDDISLSFNFDKLSQPECSFIRRIVTDEDRPHLTTLVGCTIEAKLEYFPVLK